MVLLIILAVIVLGDALLTGELLGTIRTVAHAIARRRGPRQLI